MIFHKHLTRQFQIMKYFLYECVCECKGYKTYLQPTNFKTGKTLNMHIGYISKSLPTNK